MEYFCKDFEQNQDSQGKYLDMVERLSFLPIQITQERGLLVKEGSLAKTAFNGEWYCETITTRNNIG
jgi:hypothetical protein